MNKFLCIALALCAAVAVASAAALDEAPEIDDNEAAEIVDHEAAEIDDNTVEQPSRKSLWPSDEAETANMPERLRYAEGFCLQARESFRNYLKDAVNKQAAGLFNMVLSTATKVVQTVGKANEAAAEKGSAMVSEDVRQFKNAVGEVLKATKQTGHEQVLEIFEAVRENLSFEKLISGITEACQDFKDTFIPNLQTEFRAWKKSLKDGSEDGSKDSQGLTIGELGCRTTGFINRINTICSILVNVKPMLMNPGMAQILGG